MKFARARVQGEAKWARIDGDWLTLLDRAPWDPKCRDTVTKIPVGGTELLVPAEPSKIAAVGQNYKKHIEEMGREIPKSPIIFLKPPSALNPHNGAIVLPPESSDVQHEAELALVVGKRLRRADEAEARAGIFGVTCFNDVTARDIQKREVQNVRAKGFDTFACCGPWIETEAKYEDAAIRCRVNGQLRQDGRTSDMLFSPAYLVSFLSHTMTLMPGDLISTGTPSGVGRLSPGDKIEIEIEGIGTLVNLVEKGPRE